MTLLHLTVHPSTDNRDPRWIVTARRDDGSGVYPYVVVAATTTREAAEAARRLLAGECER